MLQVLQVLKNYDKGQFERLEGLGLNKIKVKVALCVGVNSTGNV